MKLIDAYIKLKALDTPILQTKDVAAYFDITINHANKLLSRIAQAGQLVYLKKNCWVFPDIDSLFLPAILAAPFPAYISLQTALYYHNMISQIPTVIYAVSVARTIQYQTPIADISIHHLNPSFYFGYEEKSVNGLLKIATPEKALLDIFYLSQGKTRLFNTLPEVELPKNFNINVAKKMIDSITPLNRRTLVRDKFTKFIDANKSRK